MKSNLMERIIGDKGGLKSEDAAMLLEETSRS